MTRPEWTQNLKSSLKEPAADNLKMGIQAGVGIGKGSKPQSLSPKP